MNALFTRMIARVRRPVVWGLLWTVNIWKTSRHATPDAYTNDEIDADQTRTDAQDKKRAVSTLRKRFRQAMQTLANTPVYGTLDGRWRSSLPWYLVLGPQGSGKTSLIEYSGLNLPPEVGDGKDSRPPEPTNDCRWYFAEQGVLVDTSPQHLTHGTGLAVLTWQTLLGLIAKQRRHRSLNGVLIAVPVTMLLAKDEGALKDLAHHVSGRMRDIQRHLRCQPPVYLVLSKADQLRGFDCFYDRSEPERSELIPGVSNPDGACLDGHMLEQLFADLLDRLSERVTARVQREAQPRRVSLIIDLPRQVERLIAPLSAFVEHAFSANRYQPAAQLRGVYLCSAPHSATPPSEGHPDNSVLDSSAGDREWRQHDQLIGQARFAHEMFTLGLFSVTGRGALEQQEIRRIRWRQVTLCLALLAGAAILTLHWATDYVRHSERLEQLTRLGEQWAQARRPPPGSRHAAALLPGLETLHAAREVAGRPASLLDTLGMAQRGATIAALDSVYHDALEQELMPFVTRHLESQLHASMNDPEPLLDNLRAYLMLDDLIRRDVEFMRRHLTAQWHAAYPAPPDVLAMLASHLTRLLSTPARISLDQTLLGQARNALSAASPVERSYEALKENAQTLPDHLISRRLDPQGAVFDSAELTIPGLFTRDAYERYFLTQGALLIQAASSNEWIMGDARLRQGADMQTASEELQQLYLRDYADHWSEILAAINPASATTLLQGAARIKQLTGAQSPLLKLLVELRYQTRVIPDGTASPEVNPLESKARFELLAGDARNTLQRRFEPLYRLIDASGQPSAELMDVMQALNELDLQLTALSRSGQREKASYELARSRMDGRSDALSRLRIGATRLPPPLNEWLGNLADDTWRLLLTDAYRYVNQRYQHELLPAYKDTLAQRYPFSPSEASDVVISDFQAFFKPDGTAASFYEHYLRPFIGGVSDHYAPVSLDGRHLPVAPATLRQLGRVDRIRERFFTESLERPLIKFRLQAHTLDQSLARADFAVGSKQLAYRHGPIIPLALQWPDEIDNNRTSLVVEQQGGRRVGYQEDSGPWSLFRLLERLDIEAYRGRNALLVKADIEGHRANYLLTSDQSPHPFEFELFREFKWPAAL